MTQRYEYTIKEISNGWIVTVENNHKDDCMHQYFGNKTDAAKYVIKLLGEIVDEQT